MSFILVKNDFPVLDFLKFKICSDIYHSHSVFMHVDCSTYLTWCAESCFLYNLRTFGLVLGWDLLPGKFGFGAFTLSSVSFLWFSSIVLSVFVV